MQSRDARSTGANPLQEYYLRDMDLQKQYFMKSFSVLPEDTFKVQTNDYESSLPFACAFGNLLYVMSKQIT